MNRSISSTGRCGAHSPTATLVGIAACSPRARPPPTPAAPAGTADKAGTATSAAALGGMDALVAAAKKEGTLNVIALPPDWANYGEIIKAFKAKYGIKVDSAPARTAPARTRSTPPSSSRARTGAPDVFDLGAAVALANTDACSRRTRWRPGPTSRDELKDADGPGSTTTAATCRIGCDAAKVPGADDRRRPAQARSTRARSRSTATRPRPAPAFSGVVMAALANGGSADDISPGVDFFKKLKKAGNFLPVDPTPATIESGQTPIVIDWDYLNAAQAAKLKGKVDWKMVVPAERGRSAATTPGDQQGRPAPGGRPAVAGVPLLRRGPEPLAQGRRPAGPRGRDGEGRHASTRPRSPRCPTVDGHAGRSRPRRRPTKAARRTSRPTGPRPLADPTATSRHAAAPGRATSPSAVRRAAGRRCRSSPTSPSSCVLPTLVVVVGAFRTATAASPSATSRPSPQPQVLSARSCNSRRALGRHRRRSARSSARCSPGRWPPAPGRPAAGAS